MLPRVKFNHYFFFSRSVSMLEKRYRQIAELMVRQHNQNYPDDPLIFYGSYPRKFIMLNDDGCLEEVTIRIIRLFSKKAGKTFSLQGPFFFKRSRYLGLSLLRFFYDTHGLEPSSFDFECAFAGFNFSEAKRLRKRLLFLLCRIQRESLYEKSTNGFDFAYRFIKSCWYVPGNPFCSEMEAVLLAP